MPLVNILPDPRTSRGFIGLLLLLFVVSFTANGIGANWLRIQGPVEFNEESTRVAKALASGQGFSNPYAPMPTGPTIHLAPVFPFMYAGVVELFGVGRAGWWTIHILMVGVYAFEWTLAALFALDAGLPLPAAALAAFMGALLPIPGSCFKWEALLTGAELAAAAWLTLRLQRNFTRGATLLAGLLWGLTILTQPVAAVVWIVWTGLLAVSHRRLGTLIIILVPMLVIAPWVVRDYQVARHLIFVRGNFGMELAVSNNDCATPLMKVNTESVCTKTIHPNESRQAAQRIAQVGEYEFNHELLRDAIPWIEHHIGRFIQLTVGRMLLFWFPVSREIPGGIARITGIVIAVITALSIPGIVLLWRRFRFAAAMLLFGGLAYSLIYYIVEVDFRYRYPTLWINVVPAAYALYRFFAARTRKAGAI